MDWYYKEVFLGLNWITIFCWIIIPLVTVALLFLLRKKLLWISPIVSSIFMTVVAYIINHILKKRLPDK